MSKIAVFGSAFNPPSVGHKSVIDSLTHFDQVLLLPSISHAWGKQMLDYDLRCELVDAFIQDLNLSNLVRSTVEEELYKQSGEPVTTFEVLAQLEQDYGNSTLTFVIGPDNLFKFNKFYKADDIVKRWSLLCCPDKVSVRSTDIRNGLKKQNDISSLVTEKVCQMLVEKSYYT